MFFCKINLMALAVYLAIPFTYAHVKIESPVPYGAGNAAPALDTNPLLADGSDFPCKQRPNVYKVVKNNVMAIGQPQTLSFQATHGGGACQISISTDKQPTKKSVWKVILSIEGGCPSQNPGNVGTDPFGYGADKFQYTIPPEITPGDYTLAWTWFNKIGEREMYMNCAPITVTGSSHYAKRDLDNAALSSDDNTFAKRDMSSLPDMFVANIGNGCSTAPSGTDLAIPVANRGKYIQRFDTGPLTPPVGNCGGSSSDGTGAGTAVPVPPAAQPSAHAPSPSPEAQPSTPALQPPPHPQPQPQPQLQPSAPSAQPQGSPSSAALTHIPSLTTGTCHTPGKSVCSPDSLSIGTCDEHNQVIFQPVPLGTKCDKALGVEVHARRSHMLRRKSEGTSDTKTFRKKQVDGDVGERGWGVVNCERADTPGCDSVLQHEKHTRVEMEEMSVGELRALSSGGRGLRGRSRCAGHGTLLRSEKGLAGDGDVEE